MNAIELALNSKHLEVKQLVARVISSPIYLEKLCTDSSSRVHYAALKSIKKEILQSCYKHLFEQAIFDRTKKIREYGRFVLKQLGVTNFKKIYADKIENQP